MWRFCFQNQVLALKGSYHGDTLGAMEAQAPSPYTGVYQQPWYGYFTFSLVLDTRIMIKHSHKCDNDWIVVIQAVLRW